MVFSKILPSWRYLDFSCLLVGARLYQIASFVQIPLRNSVHKYLFLLVNIKKSFWQRKYWHVSNLFSFFSQNEEKFIQLENDILNQPDDDVSSTNAPSIGLPDIMEEGGNAEAYTYEHDSFNPSVQLQDIRQEKQSEL